MIVKGMSGNYAGKDFSLEGSLVFGRNPQNCNILFPDNVKGVSRTHCKIDIAGMGAILTDMGSSFGTFLNGRKLAPYTPTPINIGDTFWIGGKENAFTLGNALPARNIQQAAPLQPQGNSGGVQGSAGLTTGIKIAIAGGAAVIVILIAVILSQQNKMDVQQMELEHKQEEIDDFNNRSPLERIIDGVGGVIDILPR